MGITSFLIHPTPQENQMPCHLQISDNWAFAGFVHNVEKVVLSLHEASEKFSLQGQSVIFNCLDKSPLIAELSQFGSGFLSHNHYKRVTAAHLAYCYLCSSEGCRRLD